MSGHHKKTLKKHKKNNIFNSMAKNLLYALNNSIKTNKTKKNNNMNMKNMLSAIDEIEEEMHNEEFTRAAENMEKKMKNEMKKSKTRKVNVRRLAETLRRSARAPRLSSKLSIYEIQIPKKATKPRK